MQNDIEQKARSILCYECGKPLSDGHQCDLVRFSFDGFYGAEESPAGSYTSYHHASQIIESQRQQIADKDAEIASKAAEIEKLAWRFEDMQLENTAAKNDLKLIIDQLQSRVKELEDELKDAHYNAMDMADRFLTGND